MSNLTKLFFFILLHFSISVFSQQDSATLEMRRLQNIDIQSQREDTLIQQVISVTRSAIPLSQSPFETYVITQDEIRRFGCNTLVDVLRLIPGIRTSKIGSAMEGELFMANGLRGNTYFQFLINDIPIRPFTTRGMSLGAQLPIKQAERIEVQLGAAVAEYGMLSGGGVINIILKESERPVYASAELNFGRYDYNNIDVNFGGKIGQGKHVARFNVFGGYSLIKNRPIISDSTIYQPFIYNKNKEYLLNANGKDWDFVDSPYVASYYNLPNFSRYAGINLTYRNFYLFFQQNSRRDHSALGLNPSVLSYIDESSNYQDNTYSLNLGYKKVSKTISFCVNSGFNAYKVSPSSSSIYYVPSAALFLDSVANSSITIKQKAYFEEIRKRLSERPRYWSGREINIPFYANINKKIGKHYLIGAGVSNDAMIYYNQFAYDLNFRGIETSSTTAANRDIISNNGIKVIPTAFAKIGFQTTNTFVLLDYSRGRDMLFDSSFVAASQLGSIRLGINQKIKIKNKAYNFKLNANNSKLPINNYYHQSEIFAYALRDTSLSPKQNISFRSFNPNALAQRLTEAQIGIMRENQFLNIQLQYQYHKINNIPIFHLFKQYNALPEGTNIVGANGTKAFTSGFDFNKNDYQLIHQIKYSTILNINLLAPEITNRLGTIYFRYAFTRQWGEEFINNIKYNYVRQLPKNNSQLGLYLKPYTTLSFSMNWNYFSSFHAANQHISSLNNYQSSKPYHQFDFILDYSVNDNLSLRVNIYNAFNRKIYGIDATETSDDLIYNIQAKRFSQIGVSYNLDYKPKNIVSISSKKGKSNKHFKVKTKD